MKGKNAHKQSKKQSYCLWNQNVCQNDIMKDVTFRDINAACETAVKRNQQDFTLFLFLFLNETKLKTKAKMPMPCQQVKTEH